MGTSGRRAIVVGVVVLVALAAAIIPAASLVAGRSARATDTAGDFTEFMHDNQHSGFSADATAITPSSTLDLQWKFQEPRKKGFPPRFFATPLVIQGVIYIGSNTGQFYAIDLATGTVLWHEYLGVEVKATCRQLGILATATSGLDPTSGLLTIYVASGDGNVYALNAADGTILWTSPVNVPDPGTNDHFAYSSPILANGKIYVGISSECDTATSPITTQGGVASLDQATGARIATFYDVPDVSPWGGSVWSSPAIGADGSVFITTGDGNTNGVGTPPPYTQAIVKLDPDTLQPIDSWQILPDRDSDFGGSATMFTATLNGVPTPMVGAGDKNGIYYAWQQSDLAAGPVWTAKISGKANSTGNLLTTAIWDGNNLYVAGPATTFKKTFYRGSIRKLDPATGNAIWKTGLPAALVQSPTMDGAGAIAAQSYDTTTGNNAAFLIDATNGSYRLVDDGSTPNPSSPVFGEQYLILPTITGAIYCYTPDTTTTTSDAGTTTTNSDPPPTS